MANIYCSNCGSSMDPNSRFCGNCGQNNELLENTETQNFTQVEQSPTRPISYSEPVKNPQQQPQMGAPSYQYQKVDYIRPPDYKPTTSISERISGTLKLNLHVVEEIEDREDLQDEAQKLLIANFVIISAFNILSVLFFSDSYVIYSAIGTIFEIIIVTFVGGFAYIAVIAGIGGAIGGQETIVSRGEIIRVLSYAYVGRSLVQMAAVLDDMVNSILTIFIWLGLFIYSAIVFVFVIRRALDKGYGTAIVTIVISLVISFVIDVVLIFIVGVLFGGTYDLI